VGRFALVAVAICKRYSKDDIKTFIIQVNSFPSEVGHQTLAERDFRKEINRRNTTSNPSLNKNHIRSSGKKISKSNN